MERELLGFPRVEDPAAWFWCNFPAAGVSACHLGCGAGAPLPFGSYPRRLYLRSTFLLSLHSIRCLRYTTRRATKLARAAAHISIARYLSPVSRFRKNSRKAGEGSPSAAFLARMIAVTVKATLPAIATPAVATRSLNIRFDRVGSDSHFIVLFSPW